MSNATTKRQPRTAAERRRARASNSAQPSLAPEVPSRFGTGLLVAALLLVCTLAIFLTVGHFDFVVLDDNIHVYKNTFLNPPSTANIAHFWRGQHENLYIPVTYTVWMLLALASGHGPHTIYGGDVVTLDPAVFHSANMIVHLATTLLVFLLLRRLVRKDWAAGAGALLFAIHPVQAESVAWISEMKGLLSGFFGMLALWLYVISAQIGPGTKRWLITALSTMAFVLALFSKPNAVALPLIAFVIDFAVLKRPVKQYAPVLSIWLILAAAFTVIAHGAQPVTDTQAATALWQRPVIAADALTFYMGKALLPLGLGVEYGRNPKYVLAHGLCWLTIPLVIGIKLACWSVRKRWPWLIAAFGIFAAAVLPVLGFVPFLYQSFSTVADRYLYVAMLGPAMGLAMVLATAKNKAIYAFAAMWLVGLGTLMTGQLDVWRNNLTLFEHGVRVNPHSWLVQVNLASAYGKLGRHDDAIRTAQAAYGEVKNDRTYTQLGVQYGLNQQYAEAIPLLRKAVELKPTSDDALPNLVKALNDVAFTQARAGKMDDAIAGWREAIALKPDYPEAHYNLGLAYSAKGRRDDAISELKAALQYRPGYALAQNALAKVMVQGGADGR